VTSPKARREGQEPVGSDQRARCGGLGGAGQPARRNGKPDAYLDYARWAVPPYRHFILGPFSRHIGLLVGAIALGQLTIAILVAARGRAVVLGLVGAVIFLLAIAPLGRGSAFPFSLTVSVAAGILLRDRYDRTLCGEIESWGRRRRARSLTSS
jgi:hypothetical protein